MVDNSGRDDHHDPTAGVGGAAPARSALTLRLFLAGFGFVICCAFAVAFAVADVNLAVVALMALLALVGLVDIVVIVRRRRRGEPS